MDASSEHSSWEVVDSSSNCDFEEGAAGSLPFDQASVKSVSAACVKCGDALDDATTLLTSSRSPSPSALSLKRSLSHNVMAIPGPSDTVLTNASPPEVSDLTFMKGQGQENLSTAGSDSPHSWGDVESAIGSEGLHRWQNTHSLASDIREAWGAIPPVHTPTRYCSVILVGPSGSGKSTLCQNLAALQASRPCHGLDLEPMGKETAEVHVPEQANVAKPHDWRSAEEYGLEQLRTSVIVKDGTGRVLFVFNLQDTPGLEESEDMEKVLKLIQVGRAEHFKLDQDPARDGPLTDYPDRRFDACFYFVGPHRVGKGDISNMIRLSKLVPVIPLLAKADAMLPQELDLLGKAVRKEIAAREEREGETIIYKFPEELLVAARRANMRTVPPFAVVGSTESVEQIWTHLSAKCGPFENIPGARWRHSAPGTRIFSLSKHYSSMTALRR